MTDWTNECNREFSIVSFPDTDIKFNFSYQAKINFPYFMFHDSLQYPINLLHD